MAAFDFRAVTDLVALLILACFFFFAMSPLQYFLDNHSIRPYFVLPAFLFVLPSQRQTNELLFSELTRSHKSSCLECSSFHRNYACLENK